MFTESFRIFHSSSVYPHIVRSLGNFGAGVRNVLGKCATFAAGFQPITVHAVGGHQSLESEESSWPGRPSSRWATKIRSNTVSLITANGPIEADTKHEVHMRLLGNPLQFVQLLNTPAVCSVGKKCMEQGFHFIGQKGEAPYLICPNGRKVQSMPAQRQCPPCLATEDHCQHVPQRHLQQRIAAGSHRLQSSLSRRFGK